MDNKGYYQSQPPQYPQQAAYGQPAYPPAQPGYPPQQPGYPPQQPYGAPQPGYYAQRKDFVHPLIHYRGPQIYLFIRTICLLFLLIHCYTLYLASPQPQVIIQQQAPPPQKNDDMCMGW
ncbi:hypothetical protein BGZ80_010102 [Entomortierella chlamydospora]|uniref:Uncharacterized protein n=1 Tax=Entomortierella chlamydospora TaxID=101097 RepID=A0A9P6MW47_9FUNG|nr:hypothetical protein BGZ80_010102 [Entomortierella chlamydospora]